MTPRLKIASEQLAALVQSNPPGRFSPLNYAKDALVYADALIAEHERTRKVEPEHRCGVQGFDGMNGDVCPHPMCEPAPQADSDGLLDTHNYRSEYNSLIQLIAEQSYAVGIGETMTAEDRVRRVCARIRELEKECFALAANQCHEPIAGEHGHHLCAKDARIRELEARLRAAEYDLAHPRRERDEAMRAAQPGTAGRVPIVADDTGQREAMAERLTNPSSTPAATTPPHEIPDEVARKCIDVWYSTQCDAEEDEMRAALREYDRQMPALRGRVLGERWVRVVGGVGVKVYATEESARSTANYAGGTVHRVALVELGEA